MNADGETFGVLQEIDFLPEEYRAQWQQRRRQFWRRVVLLCMLLGIVAGWWGQRAQLLQLEARRDQLQAEAAVALARVGNPQHLKRRLQQLSTHATLLALLKLRPSFSRVLLEVATGRPQYVSLTDCVLELDAGQEDQRTRSPSASAKRGAKASSSFSAEEQDLKELRESQRRQRVQVTIRGLAPDDMAVYAYVRALLETGLFEKVQLVYTEAYEYGEYQLRSFKLTGIVRQPAACASDDCRKNPPPADGHPRSSLKNTVAAPVALTQPEMPTAPASDKSLSAQLESPSPNTDASSRRLATRNRPHIDVFSKNRFRS